MAPEPLVADGDDLAVGKLVGLLQGAGGGSSSHLLLKVKSDIAQLLLDVPHDLPLGSGGERVTPLGQDLHEVVGGVTTSKVEPEDGVGKGISLIDGDCVGHTVTGVKHNTGGTAEAYRESTAWIATYMAGVLKVSNMIWVIFSLLALGLRGASVRRTGCSSGATRSSL